ncbi:ornithine--oxo-acid transaminase, partial [Pseudonocardia sp. SID8383]|nr:ornithine--oxo-acid transaminase [Pseudonocardia sp. SID8383]
MSGTPSGTHSSPAPGSATAEAIDAAEAHSAHNYHPLPVVVASAEGAWMTDVDGKR